MSISSHAAAPFIACLLAAVMAAPALAVTKARAADPARPGDRILTPAQLQECVVQKDRLNAQSSGLPAEKAAVGTDKAEIDRLATALDEETATLDRTSAEAVDALNAKIDQRNKLIDGYQARVTAYNVQVEALKTARQGYEKACENRRYDDRDLDDLKRKKK